MANSVGAAGRVVGPGAGGVIVTIAAPPAGTYDIQVFAAYDLGAPVAADLNNMELRAGGVVITALEVLAVINIYGPPRIVRRTLDGATALTVNATGAGTAGVGYNAQLIATRIEWGAG